MIDAEELQQMTREELEQGYTAMVKAVHDMAGPATAWQRYRLENLRLMWKLSLS